MKVLVNETFPGLQYPIIEDVPFVKLIMITGLLTNCSVLKVHSLSKEVNPNSSLLKYYSYIKRITLLGNLYQKYRT